MNLSGSLEYPDVPSWIRISGDFQGIAGQRGGTIKQVYENIVLNEFETAKKAATVSGTCYTSIIKCLNGTQDTAGGYVWHY
jgi:hypothetical protein